MKFKLAVPEDVLNAHQIGLVEKNIAGGVVEAVAKNFPNWKERAKSGEVSGGEIILQKTDLTEPIKGLKPGVHLTISLVSFMPGRDFDGLAQDVIRLIKGTKDATSNPFMKDISVFAQLTLDCPVVKMGTGNVYVASGSGLSLLEYLG